MRRWTVAAGTLALLFTMIVRGDDREAVRLTQDLARLRLFAAELHGMEDEMDALRQTVQVATRGHFTSDEHDRIENLLFRYLMCRRSLWEMVDYYRDYRKHFRHEPERTKGFVVGFSAAVHLAYYGSRLVAAFVDSDAVIAKLNEAYYRVDIEPGTYDRLFDSVTAVEHIRALRAAWQLFGAEAADPSSTLARLLRQDADCREAVRQLSTLYLQTQTQTEYVLTERSLLFPAVRNRLRHTEIVRLIQRSRRFMGDNLFTARGILFEHVSRLKSPTKSPLHFSSRQVAYIHRLLRPGDVILTFSAGYMSNIFLPGAFKHGITFVGSPAARRQAGLFDAQPLVQPAAAAARRRRNLRNETLPGGQAADVIEAVAEGVVFNSLDALLATHINRMLVLRPRIDATARRQQLLSTFGLLGDTYDFKFDFSDATHQCCTEVIYRGLHGRGPITFTLTKRAGVQTLSADDIILQHLQSSVPFFDLVLLAESRSVGGHRAVIRTGMDGDARLRELMAPFMAQ